MFSVPACQHSRLGETQEVSAVALVLPLPPSINHQYATVQGRRVLSRAGRDYKAMVVEAVETWQEQQRLTAGALAGLQRHYLALTIHFYFASALRRDLDGGLKIAQDALCEALGINDNLVAEIHLYKRVDRHQPRIELELIALPQVALQAEAGRVRSSPLSPATRPKRRRRRRKQRSLEELTIRYNW